MPYSPGYPETVISGSGASQIKHGQATIGQTYIMHIRTGRHGALE
jgi:hypothetical protein